MQADRAFRRRRTATGSSLTELPLALSILFFFVLFPMIDMVGLATGAATAYLLAHETASTASQQRRYMDALTDIQSIADAFKQSGLGRFAKMVPVGGYGGCGVDLYIDASNYRTAVLKRFGPNAPVPPPIDLTSFVYECTAQVTFEIGPAIDLSFLPVLGSVPGLGKPAVLTYWASRAAEHPIGLEQTSQQGNSGGTVPVFNQTPSEPSFAGANQSDWNFPSIYDQIQAAGQTVVSENVITVQANYGPLIGPKTGGWVNSGITVQSGQKVWLDSQAVGTWGCLRLPGNPALDAKGMQPPLLNGKGNYDLDLSAFMLIGYVGNPPIQPYNGQGLGRHGDSRFIPSGDLLLNYPINYSGQIYLGCNDNQASDWGSQTVRVIIAQ
jgi:hypothetical protein